MNKEQLRRTLLENRFTISGNRFICESIHTPLNRFIIAEQFFQDREFSIPCASKIPQQIHLNPKRLQNRVSRSCINSLGLRGVRVTHPQTYFSQFSLFLHSLWSLQVTCNSKGLVSWIFFQSHSDIILITMIDIGYCFHDFIFKFE